MVYWKKAEGKNRKKNNTESSFSTTANFVMKNFITLLCLVYSLNQFYQDRSIEQPANAC